jgi:hypothetical protein
MRKGLLSLKSDVPFNTEEGFSIFSVSDLLSDVTVAAHTFHVAVHTIIIRCVRHHAAYFSVMPDLLRAGKQQQEDHDDYQSHYNIIPFPPRVRRMTCNHKKNPEKTCFPASTRLL